jgi:hypothetical protein
MKETIRTQIQKREKGAAVAAGEVTSEDDRPAAPGEEKKNGIRSEITRLLYF